MKLHTGKTTAGYRFRIYTCDGGGPFPVHGAVWSKVTRMWMVTAWARNGANRNFSARDISPRVMARIEEENSPL